MSEVKEKMQAAIYLWDQIPWVQKVGQGGMEENTLDRLPDVVKYALSAFGVGIRRLDTEIEYYDKSDEYGDLETEFTRYKEEAENTQNMYRQQLERANQQLALFQGQKDQAVKRATVLETKAASEKYTAEDIARLEGQLAILQQTNELLSTRNAELEKLIADMKDPNLNPPSAPAPPTQFPPGIGPQPQTTGNWQVSNRNPLKSIT